MHWWPRSGEVQRSSNRSPAGPPVALAGMLLHVRISRNRIKLIYREGARNLLFFRQSIRVECLGGTYGKFGGDRKMKEGSEQCPVPLFTFNNGGMKPLAGVLFFV